MAFVHIQGNAANGTINGANQFSVTLTSPLTNGSWVAGAISVVAGGPVVTSVSDGTNTYTVKDQLNDAADSREITSFELGNVTGGPTTITVTMNSGAGNPGAIMVVDEYSGALAASDPTDGHSIVQRNAPGIGANAITSTAIVTTVNGDLIYAICFDFGGATLTLTAGTSPLSFTSETSNIDATNSQSLLTEDAVQSAAGSVQATYGSSRGASDNYIVIAMAVKPAAVAGVAPLSTRPIQFKPYQLAPFLNRLITSPPPAFVPLTIAPLVKPPIIFKPFATAPFLNRLPPPGAFATTLTAALSGLAAIQVKAAAAATGQLATAARSQIQIKASATARATVPLASAAEIQVKAAGSLAGATAMTGRAAIQTKAAASVQGLSALAARATTMLKAIAGPSGAVTLSALATVMVKAAGGITTGTFVALAGRAAVMVKASNAATAQAALSARAITMTKANAAATGATAMAGQAAIMVKAAGAVSTGAFVALTGMCTVMVKAAAQQAQATVLAAHLTIQVKAQSPAPVQPAAGQFQLITSMAGFFNPGSSAIP